MWQIMLAAAAAGSAILAKKLVFNPNSVQTLSDIRQNDQASDPQSTKESAKSQDSHFMSIGGLYQENYSEADTKESVFRFSSASRAEKSTKISRKKTGSGPRSVSGNAEGFKRKGKGKAEKKCGIMGCEKRGWVVDQRGSFGVSVCLKKRKTRNNASGKCESCTSKGNSFFSWGMNVGIMYMMSAGKTEISRMNYSLDETARVVHELKSELSIRKAFRKIDVSKSTTVLEAARIIHGGNNHDQVLMDVKFDALKAFPLLTISDAECASSVLTEDQQHEVMEMDQLEAELETELRKLPWCASEGSKSDERIDNFEIEQYEDIHNLNSRQSFGVPPSELEEKLSHLLIEQQENQIVELESELQQTHAKLSEKETELQSLKECVRRLTEFSLASASDEETEVQIENEKTFQQEKVREYESCKSRVGMKRTWSLTHITASPGEKTLT